MAEIDLIIHYFMKNTKNKLNKKIILKPVDFEQMLGEKLSPYVKKRIIEYKLAYKNISQEQRDDCLKKIVTTLLDKNIIFAGKHRQQQWEKGWKQNLDELKNDKNLKSAVPHYFGKHKIARLKQNFIEVASDDFEYNVLGVILDWLFDKYLRETKNIYEFGCGTGYNLLRLRIINKEANLWGLDWTESTIKIIKKISDLTSDKKLFSHKFDYYHPDNTFKLEGNSVIFTVASLEQIGNNYKQFINYLLKKSPKLCVHIEPIAELLDENNLLDYLSIEYFKKRNYLSGFLTHLQKLEKLNKIKIIRAQRSYTGSLFIEGHSIIIWAPIN